MLDRSNGRRAFRRILEAEVTELLARVRLAAEEGGEPSRRSQPQLPVRSLPPRPRFRRPRFRRAQVRRGQVRSGWLLADQVGQEGRAGDHHRCGRS